MTRLEFLLDGLRRKLSEATQSRDADFRKKARDFVNNLIRKLKAKDRSIVTHYFSRAPLGLILNPYAVAGETVDLHTGVIPPFLKLQKLTIREGVPKHSVNPHFNPGDSEVYIPLYPMIDITSHLSVPMGEFMQYAGEILDTIDGRNILMHELVHFLDSRRAPGYGMIRRAKTGTSKYYRSPHEFNAYYQAGAGDMEDEWDSKVSAGVLPGSKAAYAEFSQAFGESPQEFIGRFATRYWPKKFIDTMGRRNRQRFVKRASALWLSMKKKAGITDRMARKLWR